jgi:HK97 gp10 family phage protein
VATLKSNLSEIARAAPAAAQRALLQTGADIVDLTKQISPVDTGALRQSYGALPISSQEVHVGSDMPYAPYVEYGTVHSAAQPHLTPAFMQAEDTFKHRLAEEIAKLT